MSTQAMGPFRAAMGIIVAVGEATSATAAAHAQAQAQVALAPKLAALAANALDLFLGANAPSLVERATQ